MADDDRATELLSDELLSDELLDDGPGRPGTSGTLDLATVLDTPHPEHRHARGGVRRLAGTGLAVLAGVVVAALVLVALLGQLLSSLNPFKPETTDRTGPSVLVALNDLRTYHAASGYYEVVIDQEKGVTNLPSFLAGERVVFVAAGTVDATVDFTALQAGSVTTNAERTSARITLPAPVLGDAHLDLSRSYVADHQRGLRERLQDAAGNGTDVDMKQIYALAEQRIAAAGAGTDDLRSRAESNTRIMLTAFLRSLGYTDVLVNFSG